MYFIFKGKLIDNDKTMQDMDINNYVGLLCIIAKDNHITVNVKQHSDNYVVTLRKHSFLNYYIASK